jgi:molybdenum-dependent DNA-binding transcriptional regulator ModE
MTANGCKMPFVVTPVNGDPLDGRHVLHRIAGRFLAALQCRLSSVAGNRNFPRRIERRTLTKSRYSPVVVSLTQCVIDVQPSTQRDLPGGHRVVPGKIALLETIRATGPTAATGGLRGGALLTAVGGHLVEHCRAIEDLIGSAACDGFRHGQTRVVRPQACRLSGSSDRRRASRARFAELAPASQTVDRWAVRGFSGCDIRLRRRWQKCALPHCNRIQSVPARSIIRESIEAG